MERLRLFIIVMIAIVIIELVASVSCTKRQPTEPSPEMLGFLPAIDTLPDRTTPGQPQEWYVQTSEQFDTLLDMSYGVDIMSGDTLRLKADTLFHLGEKQYARIDGMTLVFIGDSPRPTLKSTRSNSGRVLAFEDDENAERFAFRNIKLDWSSEEVNSAFIEIWHYESVLFDDVFADLGSSHIWVTALHDTFRDSELRSDGIALRTDPYSSVSDIVIDNTNFVFQYPYHTGYPLYVPFENKAASLSITNCQFSGPGTEHFMRAFAQNQSGGGATRIAITVSGNNFPGLYNGEMVGTTGLSDSVIFNVDYNGNQVTIGECPKLDTVEDVTVVADDYSWTWNGEAVDYDYLYYNIGEVENVAHAKKYCDGTHWVIAAFSLSGDTAEVFYEFMEPTVNYGSISGSLDSTAVVCWDSAQEKWIAELNVPATCGNKTCPVYWAATVTFCDSTGTSTEQTWRYPTPQSPCKDPLICN